MASRYPTKAQLRFLRAFRELAPMAGCWDRWSLGREIAIKLGHRTPSAAFRMLTLMEFVHEWIRSPRNGDVRWILTPQGERVLAEGENR